MPDPLPAAAPGRGERVALVVTPGDAARPLCRTLAAQGIRLAVAGPSVREVTSLCTGTGPYADVTALPYLVAPGGGAVTRRLVAAVLDDHQRLDALVLDPAAAPPVGLLVDEAARAMARGGRPGRIVFTGSPPPAGDVRRWARAWRGHGITVNVIRPGCGGEADAGSLASAVALLLSPLAQGITGQVIEVTGPAPRR